MSKEGIASHLAIGNHVKVGAFLQGNGLIDGAVLHSLEIYRAHMSFLELFSCFRQIGWPEQAAYHFAMYAHYQFLPKRAGASPAPTPTGCVKILLNPVGAGLAPALLPSCW